MSLRWQTEHLAGWGRYPMESCEVFRPDSAQDLAEVVSAAPQSSLVARGLGRSYGDSALNRDAGVILTAGFAQILEFDDQTGILRCQSAVSLAQIIDFVLPRGFFFPVTPGTKFITVGGAIAADVHGKNHHRSGSMSAFVLDFHLLTARGESLRCSRDENPEVFWATVGGMGLTGVIVEARLRMRPVETAFMRADVERLPDLDRLLERLRDSDGDYDYGVAWIDCLRGGRSLGRAVLFRANHAQKDELSGRAREAPYSAPKPWTTSLPFTLPDFALNPLSVRTFNALFYASHPPRHRIQPCDRFFYPLDAIRDWNRAYGRRGVLQYQALLPPETSREGLIELLEELSRSRRASFLAVLKATGARSDGLLSFPRPGHTLALDLPRTRDALEVVGRLDAIVLRHGGRLYLAKDACMSREACAQMYPTIERFLEVKAKVDPQNRFSSSQARRLGLMPGC